MASVPLNGVFIVVAPLESRTVGALGCVHCSRIVPVSDAPPAKTRASPPTFAFVLVTLL